MNAFCIRDWWLFWRWPAKWKTQQQKFGYAAFTSDSESLAYSKSTHSSQWVWLFFSASFYYAFFMEFLLLFKIVTLTPNKNVGARKEVKTFQCFAIWKTSFEFHSLDAFSPSWPETTKYRKYRRMLWECKPMLDFNKISMNSIDELFRSSELTCLSQCCFCFILETICIFVSFPILKANFISLISQAIAFKI